MVKGQDGKDGRSPSIQQTPIKDEKGKIIGTTITILSPDGQEVSHQDILNGKDGQNGTSVTTITERVDKMIKQAHMLEHMKEIQTVVGKPHQ